jgi:hypothetical protein
MHKRPNACSAQNLLASTNQHTGTGTHRARPFPKAVAPAMPCMRCPVRPSWNSSTAVAPASRLPHLAHSQVAEPRRRRISRQPAGGWVGAPPVGPTQAVQAQLAQAGRAVLEPLQVDHKSRLGAGRLRQVQDLEGCQQRCALLHACLSHSAQAAMRQHGATFHKHFLQAEGGGARGRGVGRQQAGTIL